MFIIIVFRLGSDMPLGLFFVPVLLFSILTPLLSLSYFLIAVPMR